MRKVSRRRFVPSSFTLVEMLAVIAIIAILCGLTLAAYSGVANTAARSRARSEITAISSALENYKSDNGTYPTPTNAVFNSTNDYASGSSESPVQYQDSTAFLYQQLTGQSKYGDPPPTPSSGVKIYMTFTRSQLGNDDPTDGASPIYLKDPFGNSYGYFPGSGANPPNSGSGFFDLWSTGGDTVGKTNSWIVNWNG